MIASSGYAFKGSEKYPSKEVIRWRRHSLFVKALAAIIALLILVVVGVVVGVIVSRNKSRTSSSGTSTTGQANGGTIGGSNDPGIFEKDPNLHKSFYGIAYTPEGSMMPNCGNSLEICRQVDDLLGDFQLEAIKQTRVEMEVFVGIYVLPNDDASYIRQRDIVKEAILTYGVDQIAGVTVGNEFMLNYLTDNKESDPNSATGNRGAAILIAYINDTRNMLASLSLPKSIPVGTSDAGSYFNTQVLSSVEYGLSNVHAWFAQVTAEAAAGWVTSFFEDTNVKPASQLPNMVGLLPKMYIAETGWPTKSSDAANESNGAGTASVAGLQTFLDTFVCQANDNNIPYFFFESFDEKWKDIQFGGVEGWWGLFNADNQAALQLSDTGPSSYSVLVMFDPLSSTASIFADNSDDTPPWPTTPHPPNSPIPNLRRASPLSAPETPDKGPTPGIYGKEPRIYGQPEAGLISPRETVGSNGTKYEKADPYLRVRITGLDRNRRDILVKFDAQTNLSNFTGTTYRNVSRSYLEFQQFYETIIHSNPQTIIPALPLAQTSAPTDEEDDRLVKIMLQRWITRVCEDPILLYDEDLRSFIENDFGYQPTPRPRRKGSSGFSLIRRNVPDEDEELQRARFELTKLEGQFFETAKAVDKLALGRKSLATAHIEMGNKLVNVATTEAHPPLGNALRKIGRAWHSLADLGHAQAISECVVIGDSLGYQGMNARSAKETLQMRTGVLEEYQQAVKTTISKRRQIERLKASSNIRPERVDEALEDMEEANKYEQTLARRAEGISQNLHKALDTHNRYANDDITTALIEHARSSIMYERQLLRELEALRVDVSNAANKIVLSTNGVPKPTVVPKLEDSNGHSFVSPSDGFQRSPHPPHSAQPGPAPSRPPLQSFPSQGPLSQVPTQGSSFLAQPPYQNQDPRATSPTSTPASQPPPFSPPPSHPSFRPSLPSQSPGAGPSSPGPNFQTSPYSNEPPLGGRFADGTKSMFIQPTQAPHNPLPSLASSSTFDSRPHAGDPLNVDPLMRPAPVLPLPGSTRPMNGQISQNSVDPLAHIKPHQMSASVRVQPTRPRLDAREAASKLANMF
ncbi:hypothetical protein C0995_005447 [Termitomyces sp. Mi166|nr:hypothetical protein C0995_005447 [Termitomyces sp. Mi166\